MSDQHKCGWEKQPDGSFRCTQDFRAAGRQPQTGCGATMPPPSKQPAKGGER